MTHTAEGIHRITPSNLHITGRGGEDILPAIVDPNVINGCQHAIGILRRFRFLALHQLIIDCRRCAQIVSKQLACQSILRLDSLSISFRSIIHK